MLCASQAGIDFHHGLLSPDDDLVSLDARTGKERWHKEIVSFALEYFSTWRRSSSATTCWSAPATISTRPDSCCRSIPTGELQWKLFTVPMKEGDPGVSRRGRTSTPPGTAVRRCGCRARTTRRRISLVVEHEYPKARTQDRERLKSV